MTIEGSLGAIVVIKIVVDAFISCEGQKADIINSYFSPIFACERVENCSED